MYYFINSSLPEERSGIDDAELDRALLFQSHQKPFRILTMNWSGNEPQVVQNYGVDPKNLMNPFLFFQEAMDVSSTPLTVKNIPFLNHAVQSSEETGRYDLPQGGFVRVATYSSNSLKQISYFNKNGRLTQIDHFDYRGFVSARDYYTMAGDINTLFKTDYLTPTGELRLTVWYKHRLKDLIISEIRLWHFQNHQYYFSGIQELFLFFVTHVVLPADEQAILISDRTSMMTGMMETLHPLTRVYGYVHADHLYDINEPKTAMLNEYHLGTLHEAQRGLWDGIIVATKKQAELIELRFDKIKTFVLPTAQIKTITKIDEKQRDPNRIVILARIAPEKNHVQLVQAMAKVHEKLPNVYLDIWGYANNNYDQKVIKEIEATNSREYIHLKGYTADTDPLYDGASLLVLPTGGEGLGRTLVEAQAHGLPIVSYDVEYGPKALITDGVNGYLTPKGNVEELAKAIEKVMSNRSLWRKMSRAAYANSEQFLESSLWQQWEAFFKQVEG